MSSLVLQTLTGYLMIFELCRWQRSSKKICGRTHWNISTMSVLCLIWCIILFYFLICLALKRSLVAGGWRVWRRWRGWRGKLCLCSSAKQLVLSFSIGHTYTGSLSLSFYVCRDLMGRMLRRMRTRRTEALVGFGGSWWIVVCRGCGYLKGVVMWPFRDCFVLCLT